MELKKPDGTLVTARIDRRTKLASLAATIVAGADDPTNPKNIKESVDGAFLIEAEIEGRLRREETTRNNRRP